MKLLLRFFGFLFAAGTILFVVGVAANRKPKKRKRSFIS